MSVLLTTTYISCDENYQYRKHIPPDPQILLNTVPVAAGALRVNRGKDPQIVICSLQFI